MSSSSTHSPHFDNSYVRDLPGFWVAARPATAPAPRLLHLDHDLAAALGFDASALQPEAAAALFSGNALPPGAEPVAQVYAGHQFGGFSPQLGDGRALLLGEVVDRSGQRRDIAFKGSGRTPFSRGGDGKAAVGPMLREVLVGEAMHALGIPTTRALAVVATGAVVQRQVPLPGAVLTRVAASHLRVGTFEFFAARGDHASVRLLADYAIARHDPALAAMPPSQRYLAFLQAVAGRQAALVAQWMNVGFIHGVMNTDNMTISGETIDYGPCAFLEAYDPQAVFSSIDHGGRYAYGNQPAIAAWNLARLAETLLPLLADDDGQRNSGQGADGPSLQRAVDAATAVIDAFEPACAAALLRGQRHKLGLLAAQPGSSDDDGRHDNHDRQLVDDWLALLHGGQVDFTLAWRRLADAAAGDAAPLQALFAPGRSQEQALHDWLARWGQRCARAVQHAGAADTARADRLRQANPLVIPRNHLVEEALAAASDDGNLQPFKQLLAALRRPFDASPAQARYAEPAAPAVTACYRTFCGT